MRNKVDILTVSYDFGVNFNMVYKDFVNSVTTTSETECFSRD